MSSAHLDCVFVLGTNDVQTSFLSALLTFVDALQNEIWGLGFIDGDHFHGETISRAGDHPWKGFLAYFALKLSEVVRDHHASDFLLDLAVNPHLEALHVDALTGAFALAG